MTLTVISPPGEEALSLTAAKAFLRIGHDGEDALVADLVAGAVSRLEEAAGLALVTRTLRRSWLAWPSSLWRRGIVLRPGPAAALAAVRLRDADGAETDVSDRFRLVQRRLCLKPGAVCPAVPLGGTIEADFEAGFGVASDIPEDLVHALKLILLAGYRREGETGLPDEVKAILAARREVWL